MAGSREGEGESERNPGFAPTTATLRYKCTIAQLSRNTTLEASRGRHATRIVLQSYILLL